MCEDKITIYMEDLAVLEEQPETFVCLNCGFVGGPYMNAFCFRCHGDAVEPAKIEKGGSHED